MEDRIKKLEADNKSLTQYSAYLGETLNKSIAYTEYIVEKMNSRNKTIEDLRKEVKFLSNNRFNNIENNTWGI